MKLGLLAALTGIAVAVGLSRKKRTDSLSADSEKPRTVAPPRDGDAPITGTAPQEGVNMRAASPSPEKFDSGARVTAP